MLGGDVEECGSSSSVRREEGCCYEKYEKYENAKNTKIRKYEKEEVNLPCSSLLVNPSSWSGGGGA